MGEGTIIGFLVEHFSLPKEFYEIYTKRYLDSINFINEILTLKSANDEFYISSLALNELFSAIRDELRSLLLFSQGVPISRWRDSRNNPDIKEAYYKAIYEKTLEAFDYLFAKQLLLPIIEQSPHDDPNYFEIYSSILFLLREMKIQDATLLTTAILNKANFFVTKDEPLIKGSKTLVHKANNLKIIRPKQGIHILREKLKRDK